MQKNLNRTKKACFSSLVALYPTEEQAHPGFAESLKTAGCLLYVANALRMAFREKLVGIAYDTLFFCLRAQGTLVACEDFGYRKLALQEIFTYKPRSSVALAESCQLLAGKVAQGGFFVAS